MKEQILAEFRTQFAQWTIVAPEPQDLHNFQVFENLESFLTEAFQRIEYDSYIKGYVDGTHDSNPEH